MRRDCPPQPRGGAASVPSPPPPPAAETPHLPGRGAAAAGRPRFPPPRGWGQGRGGHRARPLSGSAAQKIPRGPSSQSPPGAPCAPLSIARGSRPTRAPSRRRAQGGVFAAAIFSPHDRGHSCSPPLPPRRCLNPFHRRSLRAGKKIDRPRRCGAVREARRCGAHPGALLPATGPVSPWP